jgi:hypothetical protein
LSTDGAVDATQNDDDFVHTLAATAMLSEAYGPSPAAEVVGDGVQFEPRGIGREALGRQLVEGDAVVEVTDHVIVGGDCFDDVDQVRPALAHRRVPDLRAEKPHEIARVRPVSPHLQAAPGDSPAAEDPGQSRSPGPGH